MGVYGNKLIPLDEGMFFKSQEAKELNSKIAKISGKYAYQGTIKDKIAHGLQVGGYDKSIYEKVSKAVMALLNPSRISNIVTVTTYMSNGARSTSYESYIT